MSGSVSIVSNLWKVEDNAATELIVGMMSSWSKKRKLSKALATSKREYILQSGKQSAHPFFWAPAIVIGDHEFVGHSKFRLKWFLLLAVFGVGSILAILKFINRK